MSRKGSKTEHFDWAEFTMRFVKGKKEKEHYRTCFPSGREEEDWLASAVSSLTY